MSLSLLIQAKGTLKNIRSELVLKNTCQAV